jgi:thiol-disulfide isomerase/thioredoxin
MFRFPSILSFAVALLLSGAALAEMPFQPGGEPPGMLGRDQSGTNVTLEDFPDRVRVVTFWASWCGPCLTEIDVMEQLAGQVPDTDLRVIAVNVHERNPVRVRRMLRRLDDPNLLYTEDRRDIIVDRYDIESIPLMMMIDHHGEIRYVHQGYGESKLDQIIEELNGLLVEQAQDRQQG